MFYFRWGMKAYPTQRNSQVTGREPETPPVFTPFKHCFAYCFAQWGPAGVCQHPSSFWSITLQPVVAGQAAIPQVKGEILSFQMRHSSLICCKRLQSYGSCTFLNVLYLVDTLTVIRLLFHNKQDSRALSRHQILPCLTPFCVGLDLVSACL